MNPINDYTPKLIDDKNGFNDKKTIVINNSDTVTEKVSAYISNKGENLFEAGYEYFNSFRSAPDANDNSNNNNDSLVPVVPSGELEKDWVVINKENPENSVSDGKNKELKHRFSSKDDKSEIDEIFDGFMGFTYYYFCRAIGKNPEDN